MTARSSSQTTITDNPEVSRNITRYQNLDDNEIMITESKLENILLKHSETLKAGSDWKTPLGLIIAIITVFLTAEFSKSFLGLDPSVWQAIFIVCLVLSFIWFFSSVYSKCMYRNQNITTLIGLIKNEREKPAEVSTNMGLTIKKAIYGIEEEGKNVDVTDKLNSMVEDGQLVTEATNTLVSKDPAPGIAKQLKVQYEYNGEELSKTFTERELVNLPEN